MRPLIALTLFSATAAFGQNIDWPKVNDEAMRHFQGLVRIDSTNPPGNETKVAEYVKKVLEAEGIPVTLAAKDPARANVIARIKGNGSKRPLLIVAHSDTVKVDVSKWTSFGPFSAERNGGWVYGRGTLDDKSNLFAAMMTMVLLKRTNAKLDRDVIFLSEVGEEASTGPGIEYIVSDHWSEIDAEIALAEAGGVTRRGGKAVFATIETTEKQPKGTMLISKGPSGHGSRPVRGNAIAHLSGAIQKVAMWDPPMQLNDTTRTYFEKLAQISAPVEAQRFRDLLDPAKSAAARQYLAENEPLWYSMLHTSVSPNIINGGFQSNVIPSEATATLDVRALPGENMDEFYALMKKVINDPQIEIVANNTNARPNAGPSSITSDAYKALEAAFQQVYKVPVLPLMQTGATDMAFLRAKGMQCYGIGAMTDEEDILKGFAAHSDLERILDEAVYKHLELYWRAVTGIAGAKF